MALDIEHFKKVLLQKRQELTEEVTALDQDARDARTAEVEDPIDQVVSSEAKALAFGGGNIASDMLLAVEDALQRIERGEYGTCIDCGKPIELKRLEAVPWTPYCLEDQEKHDRENAAPTPFDSVL